MMRGGDEGNSTKLKQILKQTCSTIQQQHIRTRPSHCTLLLVRIASAMARAPSSPILLSCCEIMRMRGGDGGNSTKLKQILKQTCSTIQRQHIRTRDSSRTLLLVRIASAMARAPSSPISLLPCEIMRMRGGDGGNSTKLKYNTETNVQHNSATTHTHKVQLLHTAVGSHRIRNCARAVGANVIVPL